MKIYPPTSVFRPWDARTSHCQGLGHLFLSAGAWWWNINPWRLDNANGGTSTVSVHGARGEGVGERGNGGLGTVSWGKSFGSVGWVWSQGVISKLKSFILSLIFVTHSFMLVSYDIQFIFLYRRILIQINPHLCGSHGWIYIWFLCTRYRSLRIMGEVWNWRDFFVVCDTWIPDRRMHKGWF